MLGQTTRRCVGPAEEGPLTDYEVRALAPDTWDAYAAMMQRHNGVFGGCWCTYFHTMSAEKERTYDANCALKKRLVHEDRAHAALVFDGDEAVAWAQFGSPAELPNIYHRKQYEAELDLLPDYRVTCIFVASATAGSTCQSSPYRAFSTSWRRPAAASSRATRTTT